MSPIVLIVNPVATLVDADKIARLTAALRPHGLVDVAVTTAQGDAAGLAARASSDGATMVATFGGDGIVNETVQTLIGSETVLITIPGGNANVFARATGWPRSVDQAIEGVGAALVAGEVRRLRLGRIEAEGLDRVVALNAGVGIDAETVRWVEDHPTIKRHLRHVAYVAAASAAARSLAQHPLTLSISSDGVPVGPASSLMVALGRPYTYMGRRPVDILPPVDFDGDLAWLAMRATRKREFARIGAGIIVTAGSIPGESALLGTAHHEILITSDIDAALQVDGEAIGRYRQIRVGQGGAITILDPALKSLP